MSMLRMAIVGLPSYLSYSLNKRSSSMEVNLELPYIAQVNSSSSLKRASPISRSFPRRASGLANLGIFSMVLKCIMCPLPLKALVVSHPKNECKSKERGTIFRRECSSYVCYIDQPSMFPRTCVKKDSQSGKPITVV